MRVQVVVQQASPAPLAELDFSKVPSDQFKTAQAPLQLPVGTCQVHLRFISSEHWREASLNWFELGRQRIEAEAFSQKQTVEHWTSKVEPAFNSRSRRIFVHDDGKSIQKRPLYYVFRQIWTHAPGTGRSCVA